MKRFKTSRRARFSAAAAAVGVFASLGGVGYAAGLVHFAHTSPTANQYPPSKVTICHHTHSQKNPFVTITVSVHAQPAHLRHGDTIGPCPQQGATGAQGPVEKPAKVHGKSHSNHGHQGGNGQAKGHDKSAGSAKGNQGHGNNGQGNQGQAKGHLQGPSQSHGKGHGKGKGHDPAHGQGHGKGHDPTHGHGQGHGQGHGPGGEHGNSGGGGKGNGKKP
jgi:hypothetical protein